jgi:hypothetical protein
MEADCIDHMEKQGIKRGYQPNEARRNEYRARGGGKAQAIALIEMLERRGGRTTRELCAALECTSSQFGAITDIARKFVRREENGEIRAVRDEKDGRIYYYWLLHDADGMLGKALDYVQRLLGYAKNGRELMDVVSAYSLQGDQQKLAGVLGQFFTGLTAVIDESVKRARALTPTAVAQAQLNARPPSYEERGLPSPSIDGASSKRNDEPNLWDVAKKATAAL